MGKIGEVHEIEPRCGRNFLICLFYAYEKNLAGLMERISLEFNQGIDRVI